MSLDAIVEFRGWIHYLLLFIGHIHWGTSLSLSIRSKQGIGAGSLPQNRWYNDDCRDKYRQLKLSRLGGIITTNKAHKEMGNMICRKRQTWEASQIRTSTICSWVTSVPLPGGDYGNKTKTPIKDRNTWYTYTEKLYQAPNQPCIPMPSSPRPTVWRRLRE